MAEKDDKKKPTKGKGMEITDKVKVDLEPELEKIQEEFERELALIGEALSVSARMKKRQVMRRYRSRIKIGRKRAMRRRATQAKIQRRARRAAVGQVKARFASGKRVKDMSYGERARVERMASRRKALITRTTRRMVRVKRQTERKRLSGK